MASLFVIRGRDQGRRFELSQEVYVIGRDHDSDIQIHDSEVSRRHTELRRADDHYTLFDLDSSNGCFINGVQADEQLLRSGDRLQLGSTLLIYTSPVHGDVTESGQITISERPRTDEPSQIVSSLGPEEYPSFDGDSPWLARARRNLQVMYRTALAVSHTLDIDELLVRILDLIFEWVDADRGCVMLLDSESGSLIPKARRDRRANGEGQTLSISRTILEYVLKNNEGVVTSNASDDQRWEAGRSILTKGVREAICVPMQGRYGTVGAIYVDTYTPPGQVMVQGTPQNFSSEHLKLMVAIGHQAALAVEDTSYYSALVEAERMAAMGKAIAGLSHDVKNILQGMQGGSYLVNIGLENDDGDAIRKGWSIVEKNQERISNLVMDMLTFSKDRRPEFEEHDLNQLVADVCELMQARADEAQTDLICDYRSDLPPIMFDADLMHRAILNVVANAVDACRDVDDAVVSVSTSLCDDSKFAVITISDNGEGIPESDLARIFLVFESTKGSRGTGLGLPVSLKILKEHEGTIEVESEPGQGSCFRLQFPIRPT
jgi:signal transduction histidine kinase